MKNIEMLRRGLDHIAENIDLPFIFAFLVLFFALSVVLATFMGVWHNGDGD